MKLVTIQQAKSKGIFRDGDEVDLTEIIHPEEERVFIVLTKESGCNYQRITSKALKWFYSCNSDTRKPLLVGMPNEECKIDLKGKNGFINGTVILDSAVNYLYANNKIGIYGRQFTQQDYYGVTKKEIDETTPFERRMYEVKDVEKVYTSTPTIKSFLGVCSNSHYTRYGFMKVEFNHFSLNDLKQDDEWLSEIMPCRENEQMTLVERENLISTPLFPILYGKIDDLLVDISDLSSQLWKLYPPKKSEE